MTEIRSRFLAQQRPVYIPAEKWCPYGYNIDPNDRHLAIPDMVMLAVIDKACKYVHGGATFESTGKWMPTQINLLPHIQEKNIKKLAEQYKISEEYVKQIRNEEVRYSKDSPVDETDFYKIKDANLYPMIAKQNMRQLYLKWLTVSTRRMVDVRMEKQAKKRKEITEKYARRNSEVDVDQSSQEQSTFKEEEKTKAV